MNPCGCSNDTNEHNSHEICILNEFNYQNVKLNVYNNKYVNFLAIDTCTFIALIKINLESIIMGRSILQSITQSLECAGFIIIPRGELITVNVPSVVRSGASL